MYKYTGKKRSLTFNIISDSIKITYDGRDSFTFDSVHYSAITNDEFAKLSQTRYDERFKAFTHYIESQINGVDFRYMCYLNEAEYVDESGCFSETLTTKETTEETTILPTTIATTQPTTQLTTVATTQPTTQPTTITPTTIAPTTQPITTTPPIVELYGYLYNYYAAINVNNLANTGWRVPSQNDYVSLRQYIESTASCDINTVGAKLKEIGTTYWTVAGGTNIYGFNARGNGQRNSQTGNFTNLRIIAAFMTNTEYIGGGGIHYYMGMSCIDSVTRFDTCSWSALKGDGTNVRLLKDSTTLSHGQTGTYIGNDGKVYNTICIGTQEWLSQDLQETKYRNGSIIPELQSNSAWINDTTGGRCYYVI